MIIGDMERKRAFGLKKVLDAIEEHNGTTLLSTGITGDDARLALAAVEAGARLLEPNHPAVALARGHKGVKTMHAAEDLRHEIALEEMAKVVTGVRNVVGPEIYITVGVPGSFTETMPTPLTDENAYLLSRAGADGIHTHKSTIQDLADIVEIAHKNGLLIDAYIAHPSDRHLFGVPAETPKEVADYAKAMEDVGVDMIGLMTGMSYEGVSAGEIAPATKERLDAMISSVSVPTIAEGGINTDNFKAFIGTGVNILVVGTAIDDIARQAVRKAVKQFVIRN
jgi:imidazole glycerol phosphate synthase subunit HisF